MVGVLYFCVVAGFQGKVAVPAGIDAIYRQQTVQVRKGHWKGFFAYYDPKYVYTDETGKKFDLAGFKKQVLDLVGPATKRDLRTHYTGAKTTGKTSSVTYVCDITLTTKGSTKVYREVGTDTWRKTAHGWREMSTVDKSFGEVKNR